MADIAGQLREALRDRYLLERELGRGGMATVYLARDLKHDRLSRSRCSTPNLALRTNPEPAMKPQVEQVRAELARLVGEEGAR